jgi:hypothetical protein
MADGELRHVELASRRVPLPAALSEAAKATLAMPRPQAGAYPALASMPVILLRSTG